MGAKYVKIKEFHLSFTRSKFKTQGDVVQLGRINQFGFWRLWNNWWGGSLCYLMVERWMSIFSLHSSLICQQISLVESHTVFLLTCCLVCVMPGLVWIVSIPKINCDRAIRKGLSNRGIYGRGNLSNWIFTTQPTQSLASTQNVSNVKTIFSCVAVNC